MVEEMFDFNTLVKVARKVQSDRVSAAAALDRVATAAERIQREAQDAVHEAFQGGDPECSRREVMERIFSMSPNADATARLLLAEIRLEDIIEAALDAAERRTQETAKLIRASLEGTPD